MIRFSETSLAIINLFIITKKVLKSQEKVWTKTPGKQSYSRGGINAMYPVDFFIDKRDIFLYI